MKDELDFLVAHRKQTSSSGSHILFQAWHIKGKKGSKGFDNVMLSHREFWHKPGNLQTNKTEKLEVKLAGNVLPPALYTDLWQHFEVVSYPSPMLTSFKEMCNPVYFHSPKAFDSQWGIQYLLLPIQRENTTFKVTWVL